MSQEFQPHLPTIAEAVVELARIEQHIRQQGAVDSEPNALDGIKKNLESGKISPGEAIIQARALTDSRQSYH